MSRRAKKQPFIWTYVLVAVAVALGLYVYATRPVEEADSSTLLSLDGESVDQMVISKTDSSVVLQKADDNWHLLQGKDSFEADTLAVSEMLSTLSNLKATREVLTEAGSSDMERYGLASPAITVIADADGSSTTVRFGDKTPVGNERYVNVSSDPDSVYTVAVNHYDAFNKAPSDVRNRDVVSINTSELIEISITNADQVFHAVKSDDTWTIKSPIEDLGDRYSISNLGWTASSLRADEFVDDDPDSLTPYGLDQPRVTAVFTSQGSEPSGECVSLTVYIGSDVEDGDGFYFMTDKSKSIYRSSQSTVPFVSLKLEDLIETSIFAGLRSDLARFDVFVNGEHYEVEANEEQWRVIPPSQDEIVLTESELNTAWYKLLEVKVDGLAPDHYQSLSDSELGITADTGLEVVKRDGTTVTALYGSAHDPGGAEEDLTLCKISGRNYVYTGDLGDLEALIDAISDDKGSEQ